ncbi:MAG: divalent metal cation transporter [Gammaproteobacteria bacterium]
MKRLSQLGPGLMFAAVAIGVSHLVFSTQAGAGYGLSLIWLIVLISLLKYPAFRFAVDYASATGRSLVPAYTNISRIAVAWLIFGFVGDMFSGTAAVALVTAGLLISVFNLPFTGPQVAIALMVVSALVLINGQYTRAERLIKVLVLAFSVFAIIATIAAVPQIGADGRDVFAELTPSRGLIVFMIAMAGWMPIPTNGAVLISAWVREKHDAAGDEFDFRTARNDLRIGFTLTIVLAFCFLLLGTAVLFDTGREIPATAGGFATELLSVFTTSIGSWAYPIIAIAAIAVMWSTLIALMDVMPRVTSRLFGILAHQSDDVPPRYATFLVIQVIGCSAILMFLLASFNSFVMFATSVGFIAAPAVAYYNYVAITSDAVPPERRPGKFIVAWNWIAIAAMIIFAIGFLYTNVF